MFPTIDAYISKVKIVLLTSRVVRSNYSAPTDQAQPSRRMTWSMVQDSRLGQDPPLANASEPSLP